MNIYKLNEKEIRKLHNEFNKTAYGFRVKLFSIVPLITSIIFIITSIICFSEGVTDTTIMLGLLSMLGFAISLIGLSITTLLYGNMLKDYYNSKE